MTMHKVMPTTTMKPLDSVWLMMETPDTPMHVGVLASFAKPGSASRSFYADMAEQMRAAQVVSPWNSRLSRGLSPGMIPDREFDIDYHFRRSALPQPGGERELGRMVSRLHSNPLDRSRPLWEFHLIEGLERDRFAFYVKIHHALVEAVNGVSALLSNLSSRSRVRTANPLWSQPLTDHDNDDLTAGLNSSDLAESLDSIASLGKAAMGIVQGAVRPGERNSFLFPRGTPRSTLNRRINSQRRFATQQFEEQRIAALAKATDSTVNEILTYLCGSSLRRFFKEYNALPEESLIGVMPISLQEHGEHLAGNAIAGLRVPLGTHVGDSVARLDTVKEAMKRVRKDRAALPRETVTPYVLMRAAPMFASQLRGVGQFVPPLFNLAVSNTPGSEKPLYFNGARLEAIYPLSPLLQFNALSIDCVSYAGTFNIGFTGARDTLPRLQRMAVYFGKALEELEERVALEEGAA
jgi:WS/DGAT/MGAT family acyltransferase